MPILSLSRRAFLRVAAGGAVVVRLGAADSSASWALVSDTHVPEDPELQNRGFHLHNNMRRVMAEVAAAPVEGTIITGDLARTSGQPGDYRALAGLVEPVRAKMPLAMALGNHDDRANFLKAFPEHPGRSGMVEGRHVLIIETLVARLVILDSLLYVNRVAGLLGKAQRAWLAEYLGTYSGPPAILLLHHPLDDNDGALLDTDRLLALIEPAGAVKVVICGHSHRYQFRERNGLHLVGLPATGYAFTPDQPVGWVEAKFTRDGVALKLHAIAGNREGDGRTTNLRWR